MAVPLRLNNALSLLESQFLGGGRVEAQKGVFCGSDSREEHEKYFLAETRKASRSDGVIGRDLPC